MSARGHVDPLEDTKPFQCNACGQLCDVQTFVFARIVKQPSGCWLPVNAPHSRDGSSYTRVPLRNGGYRGIATHRLIWHFIRGPLPATTELQSTCGVQNCVRPEHRTPVLRQAHEHPYKRKKPSRRRVVRRQVVAA